MCVNALRRLCLGASPDANGSPAWHTAPSRAHAAANSRLACQAGHAKQRVPTHNQYSASKGASQTHLARRTLRAIASCCTATTTPTTTA